MFKDATPSLPAVPRAPGTPRTKGVAAPNANALVQYVAQSDSPRPSSRMPKLMMSMSALEKGNSVAGWQNLTIGSGRSTALSSTLTGASVRSSRTPNLAHDLNAFIQRELLRMSKDADKLSVFERMPVISEAFNAFISRCTDYQEVLTRIKSEYDEAVAAGLKASRNTQKLELLNDNSMEYLAHIVSAEKISFEAQLREKERAIKEVQCAMNEHMEEYTRAIMEHRDMEAKVGNLMKALEDMKHKHRIATDGLQQETLLRSLMVQQGKKLKAENERLTRKVTMLEFRIRNDALMGAEEAAPSAEIGAPLPPQSPPQPPPAEASSSAPSRARTGSVAPLQSGRSGSVLASHPSFAPSAPADDTGSQSPTHSRHAPMEERLASEEKYRRLLHLFARERRQRLQLEAQLRESTTSRIDRPMTPRPTWSSLQSVFPTWTPSTNKSSEDMIQEVCQLIKDRLNKDRRETETAAMGKTIRRWLGEENICESDLLRTSNNNFIGKGHGPDVAEYLRFHGLLRNRRLQKSDVESLLKEFWRDRKTRLNPSNTISDEAPPPLAAGFSGGVGNINAAASIALGGGSGASSSSQGSVQSFFMEWVLRKTGNRTSAVELAYNMVDLCSKYARDPDCGLFLAILNSEVHESAYWDQLSVIEQLQVVMRHNDKNNTGLLKRGRVHHLLLKVFPAKSMDCMLKLRFSLLSHLSLASDSVRYAELFDEDSDGNQSRFVSLIREQHLQEMLEYVVDISEAIRAAASSGVTTDEDSHSNPGHVTVSAIRSAIKLLDSNMPSSKLESIIACGLDVAATSPEMDHESIDPEVFIRRIRQGTLLCAYTRKDVDEADEVALAMLENMTDMVELAQLEAEDDVIDPVARAALAQMDQTMMMSHNASFSPAGSPMAGGKMMTVVPQVVESTLQLLKPSTVDTIQKAGHLGRQRRGM